MSKEHNNILVYLTADADFKIKLIKDSELNDTLQEMKENTYHDIGYYNTFSQTWIDTICSAEDVYIPVCLIRSKTQIDALMPYNTRQHYVDKAIEAIVNTKIENTLK